MRRDWRNLQYLKQGTPCQQSAHAAIERLGIMEVLQPFSPVLAGTIPLDIDIAGSDLDIICTSLDLLDFQNLVQEHYSHFANFKDKLVQIRGVDSYVANFTYEQWPFEIFAQTLPVEKQNAFRHMVIEGKLLENIGESGKEQIRRLKQSGMKTEPAFAYFFGIDGDDPYEALLKLENR